jgi:DNA/RNA non-specific endonuclease
MKYLIIILSAIAVTSVRSQCTVDIHTQSALVNQPVYIRPGTSQFFYPSNANGVFSFTANQQIEMWCSGAWQTPAGAPNSITVSCVSGQTFRWNNANFNFGSLRCQSWPQWTTRRISSPRCFNNGIFVDVGFQIGTRWFQIYRACHDLALETTYYTISAFTPVSSANQRSVERPRFIQTDFFPGRNVDNLYTRNTQRNTISSLIGSSSMANTFILNDPSDVFLARGHITAMTDFILGSEQQATFHFINVAPQWQGFNAGNWVSVEISSRRLASDRNINLEVYTGTFGNGQLWNEARTRFNIFLDGPGRRIPMPMIYYKILVHRQTNSGVVLIGRQKSRVNFCAII